MNLLVDSCVCNSEKILTNINIRINSPVLKQGGKHFDCKNSIAYPPFINSHDHLISNWYPKAGFGHTYTNVNAWVEDMKKTESFLERNKIWINDGSFDLTDPTAYQIVLLGIYKNLFSGCTIVQDHIPRQKPKYYQNTPIEVLKEYTQLHSLSLGNWWGGENAQTEYKKSGGKLPFIIHLGEGTDKTAAECFPKLKKLDLLKPNTLLIHGIALTRDQIKECAQAGASICWCPNSNFYLIGKTLDIDACLEYKVNVVLGTDSTMSGSVNLLEEFQFAHEKFPDIPLKQIFNMITINAVKALKLAPDCGTIEKETSNLLLIRKNKKDPFENLLSTKMEDIELLIHKGSPIYGNTNFLKQFDVDHNNYFFFRNDKFVLGHPEKIVASFNKQLGYKKPFPYLPFNIN